MARLSWQISWGTLTWPRNVYSKVIFIPCLSQGIGKHELGVQGGEWTVLNGNKIISTCAKGRSQRVSQWNPASMCIRRSDARFIGSSAQVRHCGNTASKYYLHASVASFFTSLFSCEMCSFLSRKKWYFLNIWSCNTHPYLSFGTQPSILFHGNKF